MGDIYRISAPPDHPHNPETRTPAHRHYARDRDERDLGICRSRRCQGAPILAHHDRLAREVRWLPCTPRCGNWLRYGIQPKDAGPGLRAGSCPSKAHDGEYLGLGGRRVLVSRKWTGKTLDVHRADRAAVVRQVLEEAGVQVTDTDRCAADILAPDGQPRFVWTPLPPGEASYNAAVFAQILQRQAWRAQYEKAKRMTGRTRQPVDNLSATYSPTDNAA